MATTLPSAIRNVTPTVSPIQALAGSKGGTVVVNGKGYSYAGTGGSSGGGGGSSAPISINLKSSQEDLRRQLEEQVEKAKQQKIQEQTKQLQSQQSLRSSLGISSLSKRESALRALTAGKGGVVQTKYGGVSYAPSNESIQSKLREGTIYSKQIDTQDKLGKIPLSKVYVMEQGKEREATSKEAEYYRKQQMRVTTPTKLKGMEGISQSLEETRSKLSTERGRGEGNLVKEFGTGLATSVVSTGLFFKNVLTQPIETIKSIPSGVIQTYSVLGNAGNILRTEPAFATGYIAGEVGQIYLSKIKVTKPEFAVFKEKPVIKVYQKPEGFKGTPLSDTFPVEVNLDNYVFKTTARQQLELKKFNVEKELQRQEFLKKYPPIIKETPVVFFEVIKPESKVITAIKKTEGVFEKPTGKTIKTIDFFKPEETQVVKTTARQQLVNPIQAEAVKEEVKIITIQKPRINLISETGYLSGVWSGLKQQQSQFNVLSQQEAQVQLQKQLSVQKQPELQLLKEETKQTYRQGQKEVQLLKFAQRQKEAQAQPELQLLKLLSKQQPKQKQKQLQLLKYAQKQETKQKLKMPELLKTKMTAKETLKDMFEVFKKTKTGYIKTGEAETPYLAGKKLERELFKDLTASGFVEKQGEKLKFEELGLSQAFRRSKQKDKGFLAVQRETGVWGGRLTTGGERRQIQQARKKKKINWFD
jgi:hypothetical protein